VCPPLVIDESQIQREQDRLPRGWGRFGKALTHLGEVAQPDESLLSSCIGVNPEFKIGGSLTEPMVGIAAGAVAGRMAGIAKAATKDTNLLLAATDKRIIAIATGLRGDPREHAFIPYEGLEIAALEKKRISLRWPEGSLQLGGIHKKQLPAFVEAIRQHTTNPA
jgi:Bacterial PH domain